MNSSQFVSVVVVSLLISEPVAAQSLRLTGTDGRAQTISAADLRGMTRHTVTAKAHNDSGTFAGVNLADLVARTGTSMGDSLRGPALATYVLVEAADGYRVTFAAAELSASFTDRVVILADTKNGQPLSAAEGPFRVIVPGEKRPARWARQVTSIRVVREVPVASSADKGLGTFRAPSGATLKLLLDSSNVGREVSMGELTFPANADGAEHQHGAIEMFYVLAGELEHVVNGKSQFLKPGMAGFVRPPDKVRHKTGPAGAKVLVVWVPGEEAGRITARWQREP